MLTWLSAAQQHLATHKLDAWLVHDFRGSNAVFSRLLPGKRHTTRRVVLLVPARGEPVVLVAPLDANQFQVPGLRTREYNGHVQFKETLAAQLRGAKRVAMEYSHFCALPIVSIVDAGSVELVRSLGVEVVSSADLMQASVARWSPEALAVHEAVSRAVGQIKDEAFSYIGRQHRAGKSPLEHEVADLIRRRFAEQKLESPDGPIVAVNAHAGDPHYAPDASIPTAINPGDWILIDLWARRGGEEHIFSDITWTGFAGRQAPAEHQRVFDLVRGARDAAVKAAKDAWAAGRPIHGWELDEAAAAVIRGGGFAHGIKHRTGHSLSPGLMVHGLGMNLDNLETHDTRTMLPGIGFTVEPGIYLPNFGVRNEINVYVDPNRGPVITSCVQDEPVLCG